MGILKPISKYDKRTKGMYITADRQERITLSTELQKELDHTTGMALYLYFDEEDRRIGISKSGSAEHVPYTFDKRGYSKVPDFLERCGIDTSEQSIKFIYEGTEKGIMVFRQVGIRRPQVFQAEKNGNLERIANPS
ncbi:hypothetical protein P4H70_23185 [Paenibacillus ehimensis]|uniref:hypothetical protein n=1 Tax=Paenibacillus ehimensis TaxID=79264 RepID=UPI002DBE0B5C|nr:hypothetical protein [Paenibacillus ehimensis]MEC0211850.1 hypothetical protein [Paenibacillus ehimensis]